MGSREGCVIERGLLNLCIEATSVQGALPTTVTIGNALEVQLVPLTGGY